MKINITLKDPDGVWECVKDAVEQSVEELTGLHDDEKEALIELRQEAEFDKLSKWIEYKEYISIEFDTEEMTARVVEIK